MEWLRAFTIVDYVVIGILVFAALVGWVRGMVEILTGFVAFLAAAFLAGRYTGVVVAWLNKTWGVEEKMSTAIAARIHLPPEAAMAQNPGAVSGSKALEWLQGVHLPTAYQQALAERISQSQGAGAAPNVSSYIAHQLAGGVLSTLVFMALVALLGVVLTLVGRLISNQVKGIPLVGATNRLLGASAMVVEALVILALAAGLLLPTLSLYGSGNWSGVIEQARLTPYLLALYTWLRDLTNQG